MSNCRVDPAEPAKKIGINFASFIPEDQCPTDAGSDFSPKHFLEFWFQKQ